MGKPRQTQIIKNPDLQLRRQAFSKRRQTLFKKAEELSIVTGSDVSIFVQSASGKSYYESYPKGKRINSYNAGRKAKVDASTGGREWEEELVKPEACLAYARKRSGNGQNNPSVRVDSDAEILPDEEIDSLLESFKASNPSLWAPCKDSVDKGDRESFWSSLYKSVAGGKSNSTCSGLDGSEFNLDVFLDVYDNCIGDRPESSTVGGGFNHLDDFPQLENLDVDLDLRGF